MQAKCARCSKVFEVEIIDKVVMLCPDCRYQKNSEGMPDFFKDIFGEKYGN